MPLRTVHVKIRRRRQVLDERDIILDPKDDAAVRAALTATLERLGDDPTPDHTITVYKAGRGREFIRKLSAA